MLPEPVRDALRKVCGCWVGTRTHAQIRGHTHGGRRLFFQFPTALTVDAAWGHRAAVRVDGVVKYVGFAEPTAVYVDLDLVRRAPPALNWSGVGDVLWFHPAHRDWQIADECGKAGRWAFNPAVAKQANAVL